MRIRYFGDSYDIVKQSLFRWLRHFGDWSVHPMFTEPVSSEEATAYAAFLDAEVVSTDVLTTDINRPSYFSCVEACENLFLDPDTGLRLRDTRSTRAPAYLFANELMEFARSRPNALTIVFDQSVTRGSERLDVERKLRHLHQHEVFSFAYISHACFTVVGQDRHLVDRALERLISESRLPADRLLRLDCT